MEKDTRERGQDMTDKEFIQMIAGERLAMLFKETVPPEEEELMDKAEQVLQELEEEKRRLVEEYINYLIGSEAEAQERAYIGGLKDGILLMKKIWKPDREGFDW